MLSFGTKRYFGIDIGESAVKLVEIKKTRDGFRLASARLVELNIDPIFDDSEKRAAVIKESIRRLLAEQEITSGIAALSISGQSVFIRPLRVPKIAKNKIEQIIQYEAQLQVPFPISEVIWNYELFEIYDSPETEVTLVAVKRDIVEDKLKLLAGSGLEVDYVEVDPFSLFNVLDFTGSIKNKIILDMGGKLTDIIIAEEHKIWTRSVLVGGNDLTKAVAASLKISFKEAEELKRKEGIIAMTEAERTSTPHAADISDAISPVLVELLRDVSKSIGYYKSQFGETKMFKEILITGGCSKLRNISHFISENIDMPTKTFNLFETIKDDLDFQLTEDLVNRMDVCVGLALRTVTPLTTRTNLLPKEMFRAKEFEKKKWYVFGSLLMAIFIFLTLTGFTAWSNGRKNLALLKASALIGRYTNLQKEIRELQRGINGLNAGLNFVDRTSRGSQRALTVYAELIELLPDNLWLTEISQAEEVLTLRGRTEGTFENISAFKNTLENSGSFKSVSVESADVLKGEDITKDTRVFTITVEMHPLGGEESGGGHAG